MSAITDELARRASPARLKARTKEAAVKRTTEWKDRAVQSPTALAMVGGSIGALFGMLLGRNRRRAPARHAGYREEFSVRGEELRGEAADSAAQARERVSEKGEQLRGRADELRGEAADKATQVRELVSEAGTHLRERVSETGASLREKVPSSDEAKARTSGWYHQKVNDQPLFLALGTMALGAAAAFFFPISRREHEAVAPLKQRARDEIRTRGGQLQDQFEQRFGAQAEEEHEEEHEEAEEPRHIMRPDEEHPAPHGPVIH